MNKVSTLPEQLDEKTAAPRTVNRYKVTIAGESYFLVSDEPEEHVRAVARLVDDQMRTLATTGLTDDPKRIAVLIALQCASKMVAANALVESYQEQNAKLEGMIAEEISRLTAA